MHLAKIQSKTLLRSVLLILLSPSLKCSPASLTNKIQKSGPTEGSISVVQPIRQPYNLDKNVRKLKNSKGEHTRTDLFHNIHNRSPRAVHQISLSDPLDCLSQIVCGLNTYPPKVPSVRTKTANDFAYLLQNVILRLKKQNVPNLTMNLKEKIKVKKPTDEQNDDESEEEEKLEVKETAQHTVDDVKRVKKKNVENHDIVRIQDLYPPFGFSGNQKGRSNRGIKKNSGKKASKNALKKKPPSQLEKLRMETDIREKLRSDARCVQGIPEHTCPFNYQELMVLTSGILERQRTVSYSTNKILPLVGYLLKSRSLTETLKSTFTALERINNITITKDAKKEPISFSHVYDEIINGDIGDIGLRVVETKNEVAISNIEDDEFDESLQNPVVQRKQIPGYEIQNRNKEKDIQEDSEESEETAARPELAADNVFDEIFPNESPEDENDSDHGQETEEEDIPLPLLYGINRND